MNGKRFLGRRSLTGLLLGLALVLTLALPAAADTAADAEPEAGVYCFSQADRESWEGLDGIFLLQVPDRSLAGTLLGNRSLRAGDVVSRRDLGQLRLEARASGEAELTYLPVADGKLGPETVLTMHLEKTEDLAPVALEGELETWRNLPNTGTLRARDEGGLLTFRLVDRPRRGTVDLSPDGSYTYTPKKNKVGEDSFTFTATDEAGQVSAPATVKIRILKPTDAKTYADLDRDQQFAPLWLRETGLFGGEEISDRFSFGPERTVTRGEFLAMVMDLEGIEPEIGLRTSGFADEAQAPAWVRPYLASALRRGLIQGEPSQAGLVFRPNDPVTQREAEGLAARVAGSAEPASALSLPENDAPLTRLQAAELLYQLSKAE